MKESLPIDPRHIAVDLNHTLFEFFGEDEERGVVESCNIIEKTLDLLLLLEARRYNLSIYTSAFFYRPKYIETHYPDVYNLFQYVFTQESLTDESMEQASGMKDPPLKWKKIEVPVNLSLTDHAKIDWVRKNRGKAPALIGAGIALDDGGKMRQLGGVSTHVKVIRPNTIPNTDMGIARFANAHFK